MNRAHLAGKVQHSLAQGGPVKPCAGQLPLGVRNLEILEMNGFHVGSEQPALPVRVLKNRNAVPGVETDAAAFAVNVFDDREKLRGGEVLMIFNGDGDAVFLCFGHDVAQIFFRFAELLLPLRRSEAESAASQNRRAEHAASEEARHPELATQRIGGASPAADFQAYLLSSG